MDRIGLSRIFYGAAAERTTNSGWEDADIFWATDTGFFYVRLAGAWYALSPVATGITGSLTSPRVPYASGATTLIDDAGMTYTAGGLLTLAGSTPKLTLSDTTASAKSLIIDVDANVAQLREAAATSNSLLSLDIANNRVGLGAAAQAAAKLRIFTSAAGIAAIILDGIGSDTPQLGATAGASSNSQLNFGSSTDGIARFGFRLNAAAGVLHLDARDSVTGASASLIAFDRVTYSVGIGTATFGTSAQKVLQIFNGTAPSTSPTDSTAIYSADLAAGQACFHTRSEDSYVTKLGGYAQLPGGVRHVVATKSADYTLTINDYIVVFTDTATATLPAATGTGQTYRIICRAGTLTVDGNGTDTIKGSLTKTLTANQDLLITDTASGLWE